MVTDMATTATAMGITMAIHMDMAVVQVEQLLSWFAPVLASFASWSFLVSCTAVAAFPKDHTLTIILDLTTAKLLSNITMTGDIMVHHEVITSNHWWEDITANSMVEDIQTYLQTTMGLDENEIEYSYQLLDQWLIIRNKILVNNRDKYDFIIIIII